MFRKVVIPVLLVMAACRPGSDSSAKTSTLSGEELFARLCASCHPGGGNNIYPPKTLQKMTLAANGITTSDQIVKKMRHPGPRMKTFDRADLSDADAHKVADYILATFR